jgi:hypothetical protein
MDRHEATNSKTVLRERTDKWTDMRQLIVTLFCVKGQINGQT